MAINPETQYPGKIAPSDADYPYGSARNITTPGDGTGTPWEAAIVNDSLGFQQALLSAVGIVPSGTPDKVGASQYLAALAKRAGVTHATIAAAVADGTLDPGNWIRTDGYLAAGDGGGAFYFIKTAAQAATDGDIIDEVGSHTLVTTDVMVIQLGNRIDIRQFGGLDTADDKAAIDAALGFGGDIVLGPNHNLSAALTAAKDFQFRTRSGESVLNPSFTGRIINSTANKVDIGRVTVSHESVLLYQSTSFDTIKIHHCDFTGGADSVTSYLLESAALITGKVVKLNDNDADKCTLWFGDDTTVDRIHVRRNDCDQPTRWLVRNLKQAGATWSKRIYFTDNNVTDFNGDLTDKSITARVVQVSCEEITHVHRNTMDGAESTTAANLVYHRAGSLVVKNNLVKDIKSIDSISIIDDKTLVSLGIVMADNYWIIADNDFDQRAIAFADSPESCIRINEAQNVSIHDNKFRGLKNFACRVYHSVDTGNPPEKVSFHDNEIYDMEWPVVCQIYQNIKKASVKGNKVYKISNPLSHNVIARTECRLVDVYQSFDNGDDIDGVQIEGNVVYDTPDTSFLAHIYLNAAVTTSDIINVSVVNNEMKKGVTGALIRFTTGIMGKVDLIGNIGPTGMTETLGAEPAMRKVNNTLGDSPSVPQYTVATVPAASASTGGMIYVTDETGGAVPAFSDGTNWRRVTDRVIVS